MCVTSQAINIPAVIECAHAVQLAEWQLCYLPRVARWCPHVPLSVRYSCSMLALPCSNIVWSHPQYLGRASLYLWNCIAVRVLMQFNMPFWRYCGWQPESNQFNQLETFTYRFRRRAKRISASVSTNTFISSISNTSWLWNTKIPSNMMTFAPYMVLVATSRWCVTKL